MLTPRSEPPTAIADRREARGVVWADGNSALSGGSVSQSFVALDRSDQRVSKSRRARGCRNVIISQPVVSGQATQCLVPVLCPLHGNSNVSVEEAGLPLGKIPKLRSVPRALRVMKLPRSAVPFSFFFFSYGTECRTTLRQETFTQRDCLFLPATQPDVR